MESDLLFIRLIEFLSFLKKNNITLKSNFNMIVLLSPMSKLDLNSVD